MAKGHFENNIADCIDLSAFENGSISDRAPKKTYPAGS